MVFRAIGVWFVLMAAESLHGTLRQLLLAPLLGDWRARQVSVFTASLLILWITYLFVRWLRAGTVGDLLAIGCFWVVLTLAFEFTLGRLVFGFTWERLLADYDLRAGGLMFFGMLILLLAPFLATRLRARNGLSLAV